LGNNEKAVKALEHINRMEQFYGKETEASISRSKIYEPDIDTSKLVFKGRFEKSEIIIEDLTTSNAVFKYCRGNEKCGVLNFASYRYAGGGFVKGSFAQEEALCHDSNLFGVLSSDKIQSGFYAKNWESLCDNLYTSRLVYSPDVTFVSVTNDVKCDVITCAAPNIGAFKGKNMSAEEYENILWSRIDNILYSAVDNGVEVLILGAFGCGVFRNDPYKMAETFKKLLENKYKGCFKKIVFAIPKSKNQKAFLQTFKV
jgi:uncharacterized protein (TIGR02452 family)